MSVNLVTLGMFYSLAVFAYVPGANPVLSIVLAGDRGDVPGGRLLRPHRGDAAGRRRLHLAEPDPRRDPGHRDRRRRRRRRGYLVAERVGAGDTVAIVAGVVGVVVGGVIGRLNGGIGFVLAATGWWFILAMWAPIYGAILNIEFFQPLAALVESADGLSFFASENGILFVSIVDDRPDVRAGRARAWPATRGSRSGACTSA